MSDNFTNVPKTDIARKRVIWKNISIGDIVFIIIGAASAFSIPFPIPNLSIIAKIAICLCICIFCGILLIRSKNSGLRMYQNIWIFLKFLITKKKYNQKEIHDTISKGLIKNNLICQNFKNKNKFLKAFKVYGIDLLNSDFEEQLSFVKTFHSILVNSESLITLIKIKETHNWDLNIDYIYQKVNEIKKEKELFKSEQEWKAKLNQLKVLLDFYTKEKINNTFIANTWYVIVYGSNESELNANFNDAINNWNRLFLCQELDLDENIKLLKNLWEPLEEYNEPNIDQFTQLPDGSMNIYDNNFKIGKNYYSLGTLNSEKFPLQTDLFWLNRISKIEDTSFVINLHPISTEQSKKIIQKSINNSAYLEHQVNRYKQAVLKSEFQNQMRVIESVKDSIATGREILINTNILFLTYGNSNANCKCNVSKLKQALKEENMYYNSLNYRQKDFLSNIIPNGFDDKIATESIVFPAGPLAGSFPIMESYQIDSSGCYLGLSFNNNSPVIVDVNLRNSKRINSNGLILGNTGSGKTTTVKKILNNHLANNGIAFVLDPEEDYVSLTNYYDGQVIDAANGNLSRINPLQILLNEEDNENITNSNLISTHVSLIIDWLKILDLNFSKKHLETIKNLIIGLYKKFGLYEKDLFILKSNEYPTFTNLVEYIDEEIKKLENIELSSNSDKTILSKAKDIYNKNYARELLEIFDILVGNFMNGGVFESLYNGHSILKIKDSQIVDFNVKNLLAMSTQNRKVAQMLLIIAFIQNAINLNGYSKNPKKALLIVDEAHLFIDAEHPEVLKFLSSMSKRIRKRSGGLWITTQNPSDFVASIDIERYTKSLIENTQYTIIQSLKPNDANTIVDMYRNTPNPITESEKQFIQSDNKGQALVIVSNKNRQCVYIDVLNEEFNAIGVSPLDKFDKTKINMNINFDYFELPTEDEIQSLLE